MLEDIFINYNGTLLEKEEVCLSSSNRSFRYGDGLFETIKVVKEEALFIDLHISRLLKSMKLLKMEIPEEFSSDYFKEEIRRTVLKNDFHTAIIRLSVFRKDGGKYTPLTNEVNYIIEAEELNEPAYVLNQKGLTVDLFTEIKRPLSEYSNIKSSNALPFVLAACYKEENSLDDCILLNESNKIAEGISSNVFVVQNGILFTPPLNQGCVAGIMREFVLSVSKEAGINISEKVLEIDDLLKADELFLTNSVNGLRWVVSYKSKRYYNNTSVKLTELLNQKISL